MNQIISIDHSLFRFINSGISNPFFDVLMPFVRYPPVWIPLYIFFAIFLIYNFRLKGFYVILFGVLAVIASDQFCATLLKPIVHRLRPCYDPDLAGQVRLLLNSCGGKFSFPSNHASNHFALAVFLISILPLSIRWWKPFLWVWATTIAFAQVYVGVHFPIDIFCGAIIGTCIGALLASLCKSIMKIDLNAEMHEPGNFQG